MPLLDSALPPLPIPLPPPLPPSDAFIHSSFSSSSRHPLFLLPHPFSSLPRASSQVHIHQQSFLASSALPFLIAFLSTPVPYRFRLPLLFSSVNSASPRRFTTLLPPPLLPSLLRVPPPYFAAFLAACSILPIISSFPRYFISMFLLPVIPSPSFALAIPSTYVFSLFPHPVPYLSPSPVPPSLPASILTSSLHSSLRAPYKCFGSSIIRPVQIWVE